MAAAAEAPDGDTYYTPDQVRWWLERWPLLCSLAESPETSVHHFAPEHRARDAPCPETTRSVPHDPMRWADLLADLEHAWQQLPVGSLERRVVALRMETSRVSEHGYEYYSIELIARLERTRTQTVRESYRRALVLMAETLGWREPKRQLHPYEHRDGQSG